MKVLYISNYKDGTGYAHAACDNILALDAAGIDVVPRSITHNGGNAEYPARIAELEQKSDRGCNVCIQHVLPHLLEYSGKFDKNIAIYYSETSHFRSSSWAERLNLFDEAWVCNEQMVDAAFYSYVDIPLHVIPLPTNVQKYSNIYTPIDLPEETKDTFKFYTIGEVIRRKNLVAALKAFHLEFDPDEPVSFVIKGSAPGCNGAESRKHLDEMTFQVKRNLKLRKPEYYKQETIITERFTEYDMMGLHSACDCYVAPSYGEAWDIPCFEAMGMGRSPIASANTGHLSYITDDVGWSVKTYPEPVFGMADECPFADLYVGTETWWAIDILELRAAMREAYENKDLLIKKSLAGIDRARSFSYDRVGALMREVLEGRNPSRSFISHRVSQVHSVSFLKERCHEKTDCVVNSCCGGGCGNGSCR